MRVNENNKIRANFLQIPLTTTIYSSLFTELVAKINNYNTSWFKKPPLGSSNNQVASVVSSAVFLHAWYTYISIHVYVFMHTQARHRAFLRCLALLALRCCAISTRELHGDYCCGVIASVREYVFYLFFSDFKKTWLLRFFEMTYQKVVKSQ